MIETSDGRKVTANQKATELLIESLLPVIIEQENMTDKEAIKVGKQLVKTINTLLNKYEYDTINAFLIYKSDGKVVKINL